MPNLGYFLTVTLNVPDLGLGRARAAKCARPSSSASRPTWS